MHGFFKSDAKLGIQTSTLVSAQFIGADGLFGGVRGDGME